MTDPDDVGAGCNQRPNDGLARFGLAVGNQHLAEFGVACHFAQHFIVSHMGTSFGWESDHYRLPRSVKPCIYLDPFGRFAHLVVQMHHHGRTCIQLHEAKAPRQALTEKQVVTVVQRCGAQQVAITTLLAPAHVLRQAFVACGTRRVLNRAAVVAYLQFESAFGGGRGNAQRHAAALGRRQVHLPGA